MSFIGKLKDLTTQLAKQKDYNLVFSQQVSTNKVNSCKLVRILNINWIEVKTSV